IRHILYSILLLITVFSYVSAQKFGEIDKADLLQNYYKDAEDADAIKLLDSGEMLITPGNELESIRHIRIKILTEKGKDRTNIVIQWRKDEKVHDLKAHTILPNGEKIDVKKEHKQEIKEKYYRLVKIAFPGVEVGSIIEFQYRKNSRSIFYLEPWYFQSDIYTKLSKLTVWVPPHLEYQYIYKDLRHISSIPESEVRNNYIIHKWTAENIKPIDLKAPYSLNPYNYRSTLYLVLSKYYIMSKAKEIVQTWQFYTNDFLKSFEPKLALKKEIKSKAVELTAGKSDENEIVKVIYDYVRTKIDSDKLKGNSFYVSKCNDVLKSGKGTVNERNMLLISLLQAAGFNSVPVLIADRKSIKTNPEIQRIDNFNTIICSVSLSSGDNMLLDASVKYYPYSLLPYYDLVSHGLFIEKKGDLKKLSIPVNQGNTLSEIEAALDEEGNLKGKITLTYSGYSAVTQRKRIDDADSDKEYLEKKLTDKYSDFTLESIKIANKENVYEPLKIETNVTINNFAQNIGDKLMLCPSIINYMKENVFTKDSRMVPIEFIYPSNNLEKVNITLPDGYKAEEIPRGKKFSVSNIGFENNYSFENSKILYSREYIVSNININKQYYKGVKSMFDNIVSLDKNQIIIGK
ncbi:DUF3857 and transglutaminase domain-containing protein, partial [candidate division KSB1 bacterium]